MVTCSADTFLICILAELLAKSYPEKLRTKLKHAKWRIVVPFSAAREECMTDFSFLRFEALVLLFIERLFVKCFVNKCWLKYMKQTCQSMLLHVRACYYMLVRVLMNI